MEVCVWGGKYGLKRIGKKIYALPLLYYLINSVISKTILFMFSLPHQKCKEKSTKPQ